MDEQKIGDNDYSPEKPIEQIMVINNNSPQQSNNTERKKQLNEFILPFTRFQTVAVALFLFATLVDLTTGGMIFFSYLALIMLVPILIVSIIAELIAICFYKATHRTSSPESQTHASISANSADSSKNSNSLKRPHIVLFAVVGIAILLIIINSFVPRYFAISNKFTDKEKQLSISKYSFEIIKKDPLGGVMTIQLDDDTRFDYKCEVRPFGLDSGYGPFCDEVFSDGSHSMGEYIFRKNYSFIKSLLIKRRSILVVDNSDNIFKVKDQAGMKLFFSELMKNTDFHNAYAAYRNSWDPNLDYIYIRDVTYNGVDSDLHLFEWADYMEFEP